MLCDEEFNVWLDDLFVKQSIHSNEKKRFKFLLYKNYNSKSNDSKYTIYEDWWLYKPEIVKHKIESILKVTPKYFGVKCKVHKINKPEADEFLEKNHFYGTTNSKVKYGLFHKEDLIAAATFSGQRQFREGRSVELLRSCNKAGCAVIGGLNKLLSAYVKDYQPDTIMTYVDLDWGTGNAFKEIGFETKEIKTPILFYANKKTGERIPEKNFTDFENLNQYLKIKNRGSLKLIKTLRD